METANNDKSNSSDFYSADSYAYIQRVRTLLQNRYNDKTLLAHVHSYGCQQNVSDGEKIMGLLALMGYSFTDTPENADIVIYNTCAVRENAEDRVFGNVGELKHIKARNPDMLIGLCGCMVQQEHIAQKIYKSYPQVDMVFGTHVLHKLPLLMYDTIKKQKRHMDISICDDAVVENIPTVRDKRTAKANLPIMYGCNNFCTYCIVPYVRGRERSRKSEDVIKEFKSLIDEGYKEITLLGQNVNSYGKDKPEEMNFTSLLRALNEIQGDFRIRFMSSHPKDASFELIDAIAECEKVCSHFHLPVQSGSDRLLKIMNRGYTSGEYMRLIEYARKRLPEIAFTSDLIVGFPGETNEDFEATINLIRAVRFDSVFSFIYSKRVGTKAALMEDNTPPHEKNARFQRLLAEQKKIGKEKYASQAGCVYRVLVEGESKLDKSFLTGRNDGYMIIDFKGGSELIGKFVTVRITKSIGWALVGEII